MRRAVGMMVARVWRKHGLKPHRIERYMASNDPDFETKAADIIGLYLNPPAHAALMRYICQYNKAPGTVKWKYADPSRHIATKSVVTGRYATLPSRERFNIADDCAY